MSLQSTVDQAREEADNLASSRKRERSPSYLKEGPTARGIDITAIPVLSWFLRNPAFLTGVRFLMLFLLVSAIYFGLTQPELHGGFTLALFWGAFWPFFTVLVTPTIGNVFCAICPSGFTGKYLTRIGLKRNFPEWAKNAHIGLGLILITYWLVTYVAPKTLSFSPVLTAWFFLGYSVLAAALFLIFRNMAYCKHVCPVGGVLSAYAHASSGWITTHKADCAGCRSFDCAKACSHHLSPFRFEHENNMADCTLCMDCVQACDSVRFELRMPGHQLARPIRKAGWNDSWTLLFITGVAGVAIQFQHGLNHSPIAPVMPWNVAGAWAGAVLPMPAWFTWPGLFALVLGLGLTMAISLAAYRAIGRKLGRSWRDVFQTLSYGLAPLVCIALLSHSALFFLLRYGPRLWNSGIAAFGLPFDQIGPLIARGAPWLLIFEVLPWIAVAWALRSMWKRAALLMPAMAARRDHVAVWLLGSSPILLYTAILTLKVMANLFMADGGHHAH